MCNAYLPVLYVPQLIHTIQLISQLVTSFAIVTSVLVIALQPQQVGSGCDSLIQMLSQQGDAESPLSGKTGGGSWCVVLAFGAVCVATTFPGVVTK